jgi:hypothetical protein
VLISATIMVQFQKVTLCIDVMKVNKMPFLVTISRAILFGTVVWLKNAKADNTMKHMQDVSKIYNKRGYTLGIVEADNQFESLQGQLATIGITINKCSCKEHVPVAEWRIHKLKEQCR